MKKSFIVTLLCLLFGIHPAQAKITVEATIDSIQIFVGQQAHVTLTITTGYKDQCVLPPFKAESQVLPKVELIEISKPDTTDRDGNRVLTIAYTFTSFDEGLYYLPPLPVKVNGKEYKSESLALKVLTIDVDTTKLDEFFPIKGVQDNPFLFSDWYSVLFGLLLLVVGVLGYVYLRRRQKSKKPILLRKKITRFVPAHDKALSELQRLKEDRPTDADSMEANKSYYTRLTDTLRLYLKERFGFDAMEMTTTEIVEYLQSAPDVAESLAELRELFQTADLVKFAKYTTPLNENDMNLVNAIDFVNSTKTDEQAHEDIINEAISDDDRRSILLHRTVKVLLVTLVIISVACIAFIAYKIYDLLS